MKIIHFIHGLSTGGAEILVKDYALKLKHDKYDVLILCRWRYDDSPYAKLLEKNDIKIIYASDYLKFKGKNFVSRLINKIHMHLIVRKILHQEKPDVVHTHLPINSFIRFAKLDKNVKLFHTVHNEPKILWDNSLNHHIDFACCKYLIKHNNMRFIVLHEEMRKEINEMFNVNNSIILNNGIDYGRFDKKIIKDKKVLRKELNIPNDAYVIGHVGRFNYQKNHIFLVDIFTSVLTKKDNAFLLMIGSGEEKDNIIKKLDSLNLQDKYLILSNRNDIPSLLGVMDCFLFPSKFEGLPVTLIEAQKMGLLCFVSDKVTKDVEISNLIINIPLSSSADEWAKKVINAKYPKKIILSDKDWNIENVVKKLEDIYLGKL